MAHEAIENIVWKDYPLTDTPITANNLNKMARSISTLDDGLTEAEKDIEETKRDLSDLTTELTTKLDKEIEATDKINVYVDLNGNLVFTDKDGADSVLPFKKSFGSIACSWSSYNQTNYYLGEYVAGDTAIFSGGTWDLEDRYYYTCTFICTKRFKGKVSYLGSMNGAGQIQILLNGGVLANMDGGQSGSVAVDIPVGSVLKVRMGMWATFIGHCHIEFI